MLAGVLLRGEKSDPLLESGTCLAKVSLQVCDAILQMLYIAVSA